MTDPKLIVERFQTLKTERGPHDRLWQDIRELVRPNAADFQRRSMAGQERNMDIYDGTAPDANKDLAAALHSYLTSPTERWFDIEVAANLNANRDPEVVGWCQRVADLIYTEYSSPESGHSSAMQEAYLDVGAFGMPIVYQEYDFTISRLTFRSLPLAEMYFEESSKGRIDVAFRELEMTPRQLMQEYPDAKLPTEVTEAKARKFKVIHGVYPRTDRVYGARSKQQKAYVSCWVLAEREILLRDSGFDEFPFHVARWSKVPGEVYGIGPAQNALPDIRMINRAAYTIIKAATKRVSPPLLIPDDGFLQTEPTTSPDAILPYPSGTTPPAYLEYGGDIQIGLDLLERISEVIRRAFFGEWARMASKKERQTAYEIAEVVEQQLRMMAPMVGRLQTELLGPMIARSYSLLRNAGRIPTAPRSISGAALRVAYVSTAARAQAGTKAISMGRYLQEITPVAQIQPNIMDKIDTDAFAEELAIIRGIDRRIIRPQPAVDEMRAQRAQQDQMQQLAGAAEPVSKAVLNLSQANQAGNIA